MRSAITFSVCFCLGITALVRGDDATEARKIIDRAIKAAGGEEKLAKHQAVTWNETGTYYGMGDGLPYVGRFSIHYPDRFRMEIAGVFVIVLDGDKGWMSAGGESRAMTEQELAQQKAEHYVGWVASLLPLTNNKMFKFALAGETKVDDRPAVAVVVSADKHRDVKLYFDKETGLLAKSEHRAVSSEKGFQDVNQEVWYQNYKETEGAKRPTKVVIKRDGERFVEAETTDYKVVDKFPEGTFAKP